MHSNVFLAFYVRSCAKQCHCATICMGAAPISVAPNVRQKQDVYIVIGKNNKKKIPQNISVYSWGRTLSCYMFGGT